MPHSRKFNRFSFLWVSSQIRWRFKWFYFETQARYCGSACGDGSGVDYTYWNIDRVNKNLSLKASPDYESPSFPSGNVFGIRLFVTDGLNTSWEDGYSDVLITGVNELKHELISPTTFNVKEGEDEFGPIAITNADDGERVTVCLDGDDSEYFWIQQRGTGYNEDWVCDVERPYSLKNSWISPRLWIW